jgi:formylmethanofuran dehydrogenase subunit D
MEKKITLNMITCRTIQQGVGMEAGKTSQKYFDACTIIHMHADDMKKLGVWKNTNVKVTSSVGSVIVKAVETREDLVPGPYPDGALGKPDCPGLYLLHRRTLLQGIPG